MRAAVVLFSLGTARRAARLGIAETRDGRGLRLLRMRRLCGAGLLLRGALAGLLLGAFAALLLRRTFAAGPLR